MTDHTPSYPPAPSSSAHPLPPAASVVRGLGLTALLGGLLVAAREAPRLTQWLAPVSVLLVLAALLTGWGAAVQLTGGEKVDDHPWV